MPSQASIWRPIEGCQSQRESKEHFEREIMYLADPGFPQAATVGIAEAKARQSSKIRELRIALRSAGLITLEEQARALALSRSTTWKLLKADHKASGISARVISQILYAPSLPPLVRTTILEYVREKTAGLYGHGKRQLIRFRAGIGNESWKAGALSTGTEPVCTIGASACTKF